MPYSILIVDDDETDRYLLSRDIRKTGLEVNISERSNGQEALEFFQHCDGFVEEQKPSPLVCFLDINMPVMDGWQFLEAFTGVSASKDLPALTFFMCSSSSDAWDLGKLSNFDFVAGYIVKGEITPDLLREKIIAHAGAD